MRSIVVAQLHSQSAINPVHQLHSIRSSILLPQLHSRECKHSLATVAFFLYQSFSICSCIPAGQINRIFQLRSHKSDHSGITTTFCRFKSLTIPIAFNSSRHSLLATTFILSKSFLVSSCILVLQSFREYSLSFRGVNLSSPFNYIPLIQIFSRAQLHSSGTIFHLLQLHSRLSKSFLLSSSVLQ